MKTNEIAYPGYQYLLADWCQIIYECQYVLVERKGIHPISLSSFIIPYQSIVLSVCACSPFRSGYVTAWCLLDLFMSRQDQRKWRIHPLCVFRILWYPSTHRLFVLMSF